MGFLMGLWFFQYPSSFSPIFIFYLQRSSAREIFRVLFVINRVPRARCVKIICGIVLRDCDTACGFKIPRRVLAYHMRHIERKPCEDVVTQRRALTRVFSILRTSVPSVWAVYVYYSFYIYIYRICNSVKRTVHE